MRKSVHQAFRSDFRSSTRFLTALSLSLSLAAFPDVQAQDATSAPAVPAPPVTNPGDASPSSASPSSTSASPTSPSSTSASPASPGVDNLRADSPGAAIPRLTIPHLSLTGPIGGITIDGNVDEPLWQQATPVTDFRIFEPVEVGEVPGRTEVRVFYDDQALYFGFRCQSDDPKSVRAHLAPREDINNDDQVGIYLDTFDDDRQAFVFYLNVLGIQQDARLSNSNGWNQSWDTVLDSKGRRTAYGFEVEVRIPFRSLRFPATDVQKWGIIIDRKFAAQGIKAGFPKITRQQSNMIAQAAHLEGIRGIASSRNLEIGPEATAGLQYQEPVSAGVDPVLQPAIPAALTIPTPSVGVNARYGLSSNVTLDFTLNPDFSQIEADPSQLDLNHRFALFYDERRPFFLEGAENFQSGAWSFYSRSIVDPLFGLKVTGKENGTAVGLLTALDEAPSPSLVDASEAGETPGFREEDLLTDGGTQRKALVTVGRVGQDVGQGSVVGVSFADKEVIDPGSSRPTGFHRLLGTDFTWQANPQLSIHGQSLFSSTGLRGEEPIRGGAWYLSLNWNDRLTSVYVGIRLDTRDFRSETAFVTRPGRQVHEFFVSRKFEPKLKWLEFTRPQLYADHYLDQVDTSKEDWTVSPGLYTRFKGQRYLQFSFPYYQETFSGTSHVFLYFNSYILSQYFDAFQWQLTWNEGQELDYRTGNAVYGFKPKLQTTFRPTPWLLATGSYSRGLLLEKDMLAATYLVHHLTEDEIPETVSDQHIGRLTVNVIFSSQLSLRAIGEVKRSLFDRMEVDSSTGAESLIPSRYDRYYGQLLLAYLLHPGTAAYLGVTHVSAQETELRDADWQPVTHEQQPPASWQLFLKLSYLWRV